jgi:hypothetical protein
MANVEGEALKRISGATGKGGGLGAITGWLAGKGKGKDGGSGTASKKTGADYHNEELSKRYEFDRQGSRREWAQADSANPRYKQATYGADGGVSTAYYPTSSGGQGTSGNARGSQFKTKPVAKPRTSGRPSRENKVPSVQSMTPSPSVTTAVESAVSTPAKRTRATGKPKA